jgi:hypothetical protein
MDQRMPQPQPQGLDIMTGQPYLFTPTTGRVTQRGVKAVEPCNARSGQEVHQRQWLWCVHSAVTKNGSLKAWVHIIANTLIALCMNVSMTMCNQVTFLAMPGSLQ